MNLPSLHFEPGRLVAAVEEAVRRHPSTRVAPAAPERMLLVELMGLIEEVAQGAASAEEIARELNVRQVRALPHAIGAWPELRAACASVLTFRLSAALGVSVLRLWTRFPLDPHVQTLAHTFGQRFGWEGLLGTDLASAVLEWTAATHPGEVIRDWLSERGLARSDLRTFTELEALVDTPLERSVREAILTGGTAFQLQAEGSAELRRGFQELAPRDRLLMGRNYLARVSPQAWDGPLCSTIRTSYGLPGQPEALPAFWAPVPEEIRRAFRRRILSGDLKRAFAGDTERHEYWSHWLDDLADIQRGRARDVEYAVLHFRGFGVVEFFQVGHAAFFYPDPELKRILASVPSEPGDLKEDTGSNRLVHQGAWQGRATRMVRRFIRASR